MGLTRTEQWTLGCVTALILTGFLIQSYRTQRQGGSVWVEPSSSWVPLEPAISTPPAASAAGGGSTAGFQGSELLPLDESSVGGPALASDPPLGGLIELNSASSAELELLPGIGPAKAEAISAYRSEIKGFETIDQLLEVKGIGPKTLARIEPFLHVAPPQAGDGGSGEDVSLPDPAQVAVIKELKAEHGARVDLNRASAEELQSIQGVGPVLAARIIAARSARPFRSVEELALIQGIGEATLDRMRPQVTVE